MKKKNIRGKRKPKIFFCKLFISYPKEGNCPSNGVAYLTRDGSSKLRVPNKSPVCSMVPAEVENLIIPLSFANNGIYIFIT